MERYLAQGLYPVFAPVPGSQYPSKLSAEAKEEVRQEQGKASLRQLAGKYKVSHETIRKIVATEAG